MNDSTSETQQHIRLFGYYLAQAIHGLIDRMIEHDASKLQSPEKEVNDRFTPMLRTVAYGSPEYKARIAQMMDGLRHHYQHNDHHPEHFNDGMTGMSLLSLLEMLCDWKAASLRQQNGSMLKSINIGKERHNMTDQLYQILRNTAKEMGWDE